MKKLNSKSKILEFLDRYETFILDCDGVLWLSDQIFEHTKKTLELLQLKLGKRLFFVSNNSENSRKEYLEKFRKKVGIPWIEESQILMASYLTAEYLKKIEDFRVKKKRVYCVAISGLRDELEIAGIRYSGFFEDDDKKFIEEDFAEEFEVDEDIGAVVVGYCNNFNHYKLAYCASILRYNPKCLFLASNPDENFPIGKKNGEKFIIPGAGCVIRSIEIASGRKVKVLGKPSTNFIELLKDRVERDNDFELSLERTCLFGDRLDTDILMANRSGITSVVTLSGVSTNNDLERVGGIKKKSGGEGVLFIEEDGEMEKRDLLIPDFVIDNFTNIWTLFCDN